MLHLALTLAAGSATTTTLNLALPLQVAVDNDGPATADPGLPSFEAAVEEAEADEYLRPRLFSVPDDQFRESSTLPGYDGLARPRQSAAVR